MILHSQQKSNGLFTKCQESQEEIFGKSGANWEAMPDSTTYHFALKNGTRLDVTHYSELKQLG